jgi:GTPase SAR1 family protein
VAYEITSRESFEKVKKWVSELEEHAPKGIVLTIAGNKADLETMRKVSNNEVEKFAKLHNATHFLVSAKNGLNVKEMFADLSERIFRANFENKTGSSRMRNNKQLIVDRDNKVTGPSGNGKKKGCCSS